MTTAATVEIFFKRFFFHKPTSFSHFSLFSALLQNGERERETTKKTHNRTIVKDLFIFQVQKSFFALFLIETANEHTHTKTRNYTFSIKKNWSRTIHNAHDFFT
jgi:hypothetical protein